VLRFYWVSWVAKEQKKLMALEPVWARFRVSLVSKLQKSERKKKWPLRFDSPHVDFFAITHNNPASKGTEEERDGMHFQIIAAGGEKRAVR